jgi:arylsulfatase A-like enzyme
MRVPLFLVLAFAAAHGVFAQRPNILFIMTDDHAAHALSAYGSKVNETPNLDRIAKEGMRFENAFVTNSICTPSRATLLTGKYSHLNGTPVFNRFDGAQPTVSKMLQAAGYNTAMIGKWHLGSDPTGFDYWNILPGQGRYIDPILYDKDGARIYKGYATDVVTDMGIEFLKNRQKDKPFFLMLHHKAPHREWTPDEKNRAKFANREIPEPETLRDYYATRPAALPENQQTIAKDLTRRDLKLEPPAELQGPERQKWLQTKPTQVEITVNGEKQTLEGEALMKWKYQRYMQDYLACVQGVDDNVGRLLDWLQANGLAENTVIFYTSDNGFFLGDNGMYDKRFMYEPSLRVPLLARWPGATKPGTTTDLFALNNDLAPTFLEIAGQPVPAEMQGRSLVPLLKGERPADWRKSMYYRYYHDPGHHNTRQHYGVRTATHKLIYYWTKNAYELFDLKADPNEQRNLSGTEGAKEIEAELKAELARLKKELKDEDQFAKQLPRDGVDGGPPKWAPGFQPPAGEGAGPRRRGAGQGTRPAVKPEA